MSPAQPDNEPTPMPCVCGTMLVDAHGRLLGHVETCRFHLDQLRATQDPLDHPPPARGTPEHHTAPAPANQQE